MVWLFRIGQLLTGALVFVVAVNLAILFYARTVTRLGEIAVRTALGASRRRILAQLFVEALALSLLGAASGLGLGADRAGLHAVARPSGRRRAVLDPFRALSRDRRSRHWRSRSSPPSSWACCRASRRLGATSNAQLHELNGRTGTRLGGLWTTLVVVQVAAAVAVLPVAVLPDVAGAAVRDERAGLCRRRSSGSAWSRCQTRPTPADAESRAASASSR